MTLCYPCPPINAARHRCCPTDLGSLRALGAQGRLISKDLFSFIHSRRVSGVRYCQTWHNLAFCCYRIIVPGTRAQMDFRIRLPRPHLRVVAHDQVGQQPGQLLLRTPPSIRPFGLVQVPVHF